MTDYLKYFQFYTSIDIINFYDMIAQKHRIITKKEDVLKSISQNVDVSITYVMDISEKSQLGMDVKVIKFYEVEENLYTNNIQFYIIKQAKEQDIDVVKILDEYILKIQNSEKQQQEQIEKLNLGEIYEERIEE